MEEQWGGWQGVVDVSGLEREEREEEIQRLVGEEAGGRCDLRQGGVLRAQVVKAGEQEHVLLVTMRHIVSDGWSMGVFNRELTALYDDYCQGRENPLKPLAVQYADYALWQREGVQGGVLEKQLEYWKKQLGGGEALELPTDHGRGSRASHRGGRVRGQVSEAVTARVKALGREEGVSLFMVLLAGFQMLLGRYSGAGEIAVGTHVANRTAAEGEDLIGFFVKQRG